LHTTSGGDKAWVLIKKHNPPPLNFPPLNFNVLQKVKQPVGPQQRSSNISLSTSLYTIN